MRDSRGFLLAEDDVDMALTGGSGTVRLLDLTATVGTAHLSTSGLAMNRVIDQQLHPVPLRSHIPVLNGHNRKGSLLVPGGMWCRVDFGTCYFLGLLSPGTGEPVRPFRHDNLEPGAFSRSAVLCNRDASDRQDLA